MIARLHFTVEGQTEEAFVNNVLGPHLASFSVYADVRRVLMSRKHGREFRGGLRDYERVKKDISNWINEDNNPDSFFTTMLDLYALPQDFPDYNEAKKNSGHINKVNCIESAFGRDINFHRFIPYIQLYEFETILLVNPQYLSDYFPDPSRARAVNTIVEMVKPFQTPEEINDDIRSSPSHRIIAEIPEYKDMKQSIGPIIAGKIGLPRIRKACPHFNKWLETLEKLGR